MTSTPRHNATDRSDEAGLSSWTPVVVLAVFIAASTTLTASRHATMATMSHMTMPGGWAMSAMWMRMPGQSWLGAWVSFVSLWVAMMAPMMLWKRHHLAHCRGALGDGGVGLDRPTDWWRYGVRLGLHCVGSCAGVTMVVLALGIMDRRTMVLAATAITVERVAPAPALVSRVMGAAMVTLGLVLMSRAGG